jgi:hypothetical protein
VIADDYIPALRLLGASYPTHPLDEMTLEAYSASLLRKNIDPQVLAVAAVRWMETEDRYPPVSRLLDACAVELRRRRDAARLADEEAAYNRGVLPGTVPADAAFGEEMADVLRTALVHTIDVPPSQRQARVAAEVADIMERRGLRPVAGPVPTVACLLCRDTGMHVTEDEPFTCRPCRSCNPAGFARWEAGHLRPGHNCQECEDVRRGRAS